MPTLCFNKIDMTRVAMISPAASLLAAIVLLLASLVDAFAWGYAGHRIIAEIAEQFLEPETARQIRDLLERDHAYQGIDVGRSNSVQRPETAPWHYVNIPVHPAPGEPSGYVPTRDCPNGACVVAKIEQFERVLADRQASERERLEALKYLVHFIGDMHQPLHASNNHDRGGNDVTVTFMGRQTNLHAVWDSGIIEPAVSGNERSYAMQLTRNVTQAELSQWSEGDPISWANESHDVAAFGQFTCLRQASMAREACYWYELPAPGQQKLVYLRNDRIGAENPI